jgi:methionyl aminopeptidase
VYSGVINLKTPAELDQMAAAGAVHADAIRLAVETAQPGVTTLEVDAAVEQLIREAGGIPTFKGFRGFPGSICISNNDMVVHGIPGDEVLESGDTLCIDIGVTLGGWVADGAVTIPVGGESNLIAEQLMDTTKQSLMDAVEQCVPGRHVGDIGHAVETRVQAAGFSVIRELIGHGVGRQMHEEPQVPNYGVAGSGPELQAGMVLAIEPMVNAGRPEIFVGDDNWSVYSADGSLTSHFEFTVAVTEDGPRILTPWHELVDVWS